MKAIILAGGRGTRLAPFTTVLPKPLMPIAGVPILEIILWQLKHFGFDNVTLACGYLAELMQAYILQNRISREMKINFHFEDRPLGTAGAIGQIPNLSETFLVMNGDILTAIDYGELVRYHREHRAMLTIAVTKKRVQVSLGVLLLDSESRVVGYDEKPVKEFPASTGIYIYEPEVLNHIPRDQHLDFPTLVLNLVAAGKKVVGYQSDAFWLDIGNKEDFDRASEEVIRRRHELHADPCLASLDARS